jgi:hypothetical protein
MWDVTEDSKKEGFERTDVPTKKRAWKIWAVREDGFLNKMPSLFC